MPRYDGRVLDAVGRTGGNVSGHAGTSVSCCAGRIYNATANSANINGYEVSFTVRATPYNGPGSYRALVTLKMTGPAGGAVVTGGVPNMAASITDTGGSFTLNATGEDGRTVNATLDWKCS